MKATIPFSMLERLIAHQTPVIPSPAAASPMAKGMRKVLHEMLMIAGAIDPEEYAASLVSGLLRHDQ